MIDKAMEELKQDSWYKSRPDCIKRLIDLFPPHKPVKIKATGQIGQIYSYSEDGTLTVAVSQLLFPDMQYKVFGLPEDDLEVCDDK